MKLVDEARQAYKWLSVQISALGATGAAAWLLLSDEQRGQVIGWLASLLGIKDPATAVVLVAFLSIIVGRLKKQGAA